MAFTKLLCINKVVQSFSKSGRPHDNAAAGAFFTTMKKEELYRRRYKSEREFRKSAEDYIRVPQSRAPTWNVGLQNA